MAGEKDQRKEREEITLSKRIACALEDIAQSAKSELIEKKRRTEQWDEFLDIMHAIADSLVPLVPPVELESVALIFGKPK